MPMGFTRDSSLALLCLVALTGGTARAEDPAAAPADSPKPTAPSLSDVLAASGIDVHGYVDVAYSYLSGQGVFTSGVPDRVFDTEPNSFNVHQAALTVDYLPKEGFGGLVNLTAGRDARVIASLGESTSNFDVTQAFVQYAHGALTLIGGKFVTLAGAEVINSTQDTNYSRSILFGYAIPFTHTGARLTYAASDQVSVIVGVNNGWDQLQDANKQKTAELGASFTPNKMFSLAVQGYSGVEQVSGGPFIGAGTSGVRSLVDVVGTYNATSQLTFILNVDWGQQESVPSLVNGASITAKWDGAAGYVNYQVNDQWRLSARAEYFDDKDGYRTGVIQKWKEATVTLAYLPTKFVEIRGEVRGDKSDSNAFVKDASFFVGPAGAGVTDNQTSIGLEAVVKF
ncbi:MAG TPA: outer membrane beta-barrel protein [Steroidobacteraceae bacterium]|nr:outer membrane beta-barrel protein [Steroidobacteraceae bacterium]